MSEIAVHHLTKVFSGTRAVDDLNFELESGRIYAFVGPNGAGKTTTMRMIATLEEPTCGDVIVQGMSIHAEPYRIRRLIGYMPDHFGVYPDMTTRDYLEFYARAYEIDPRSRRRRIDAVMDFTGLVKLNGKQVETLSKGQHQRLNLSRALLNDPRVMILDEPAAGLDPRARVELRYLMLQLAEQGKTLFVSSHILSELAEICSEMLIIDRGRALHFGTVADVQSKMQQTLEIQIRLLGGDEPTERLRLLLMEMRQVSDIRAPDPGTLTFAWCGTKEEVPPLIRRIVQADFPLLEFKVVTMTMEDVFMQITEDSEDG